ncbi:MAG TPA: hypothetical protein VEA69_23565 [Tepidisphaeraceae bacterium]|nr:hypothetical protein [Tepidisphaeraceae bacterium]
MPGDTPSAVRLTTPDGVPYADLFPWRDVTKHLPRRGGNTIGHNTIRRWMNEGCGGTILRTVHVGVARYTCAKWLGEFLAAINRPSTHQQAKAENRSQHEQAVRELEAAGI